MAVIDEWINAQDKGRMGSERMMIGDVAGGPQQLGASTPGELPQSGDLTDAG